MSKSEFQARMNKQPATGIVGQKAGINPCIYAIPSTQAQDTVTIGNFVWIASDSAEDILEVTSSGTGAPLGIVAHTGTYINKALNSSASIEATSGEFIDVIVKGDVYVVSSTKATRGQKIFAKLADGSLQTGAADATISGYVETSFSVNQGGEIGSVIMISNWA